MLYGMFCCLYCWQARTPMVALVDVDLLVSKGIRERLKNPKKLQNLREQAREGW
jgi:hypothetical protein